VPLRRHGACGRIRTFTVRGLKPPPLPLGYTCELMLRIGAPSEIRTHTARVLSAMPPAVGLPARGAPYRLRSCVCALPKRCPAIERRERGARSIESNVHLSRYKPEALPVELYGRSGAGSLDRTDGLRVTRAALCQLSYASVKKRQMDGAPASHLRRAAVARTPSNFWTLTMSNSTAIAGQFQTQSRIRARVKRERQQIRKRRIGKRMCARTRREQRKAHIGRGFLEVLNCVWAIGPSCLSAEGWPCRRLIRLS
jgi:hypothetical protein